MHDWCIYILPFKRPWMNIDENPEGHCHCRWCSASGGVRLGRFGRSSASAFPQFNGHGWVDNVRLEELHDVSAWECQLHRTSMNMSLMSLVQWWKVEQTEPCTTPLTPCSLALQAGCFRNPRNKPLVFVSWVPCWSSYVFQMFSVRSCLLVAIQIWTWCQREREGLICFLYLFVSSLSSLSLCLVLFLSPRRI